jgi:hypothetical protein
LHQPETIFNFVAEQRDAIIEIGTMRPFTDIIDAHDAKFLEVAMCRYGTSIVNVMAN